MNIAPRLTRLQRVFLSFLRRFDVSDRTFLLGMAVVIGLVVGFGACVFEMMLDASGFFFWELLPRWMGKQPLLTILTPALGGLFLAPFILIFSRDGLEDGVPAAMEAVALKSGKMKWTDGLLRMVMSALTLGSGGSAGSEGPIIHIGAAMASGVGQFLRVSGNRLRVIVACGAAAGVASIFNAPIAGVLFALEVVLGEFNVHSFSPIVIASVTATAFSRAFFKSGSVLNVLPYHLNSHWEILLYGVMGVAAGLLSVAFIRAMQAAESFFEHKVRIGRFLKPALGGLVVGGIGFFFPQIQGYSYVPITEAIYGELSLSLMGILLVLKVTATSFTLGSKGSGGILCPSLFLGSMLGGACGDIFSRFFPSLASNPGGYAVVAMGAVLGATLHAPMTAIIMVFELTNAYEIILPMMVSCTVATAVQRKFLEGSIYTLSLARRGVDIEAGREMGILSGLQVKDIMDFNCVQVSADASYEVVLNRCLNNPGNYIYVVGENEHLEGVISFSDFKELIFEENFKDLVRAGDLANHDVIYVGPDESLASTLNKFSFIDMEQLPVVEAQGTELKLEGVVTRARLLHAYRQEMIRRHLIQEGHGPAAMQTAASRRQSPVR